MDSTDIRAEALPRAGIQRSQKQIIASALSCYTPVDVSHDEDLPLPSKLPDLKPEPMTPII